MFRSAPWGFIRSFGGRARGSLKHILLTEDQKRSRGQAKHESISEVSVYILSTNIMLIKESYMAKAKINGGNMLLSLEESLQSYKAKGVGVKSYYRGVKN